MARDTLAQIFVTAAVDRHGNKHSEATGQFVSKAGSGVVSEGRGRFTTSGGRGLRAETPSGRVYPVSSDMRGHADRRTGVAHRTEKLSQGPVSGEVTRVSGNNKNGKVRLANGAERRVVDGNLQPGARARGQIGLRGKYAQNEDRAARSSLSSGAAYAEYDHHRKSGLSHDDALHHAKVWDAASETVFKQSKMKGANRRHT